MEECHSRQDALNNFPLWNYNLTIILDTRLQSPSMHWFIQKKRCLKKKGLEESGWSTEQQIEGQRVKCWSLLWSSAQRVERLGSVGSAPLLSSQSWNHTCRQSRSHLEPLSTYLLCSLNPTEAINHLVCVNPAPNPLPPKFHPYLFNASQRLSTIPLGVQLSLSCYNTE